MKIFKNRFLCVFCDERHDTHEAHAVTGNIGICSRCYETLNKTALSLPYEGVKNIAYIMAPFEYTGSIREVILDYKFKGCRAYAPLLAQLMKDYIDSYPVWEEFDCIIPVPLHKKRMKERGYNQSELVARYISEFTGVEMRTDLLTRERATEKQSTLGRDNRLKNVRGAFKCEGDVSGKKIILFDDICTTGSTLRCAAEPLIEAGAKSVAALTIAIHKTEKLSLAAY